MKKIMLMSLGLVCAFFYTLGYSVTGTGSAAAAPVTTMSATSVSPASPAVTIGVVDVQQILQTSPKVVAASDKLKQEFSPKQNQLKSAQDQLQQLMSKLDRDGAVMQAKDKEALSAQINKLQQDLMQNSQAFQQSVTDAQQKAMQEILVQIAAIVKTVAQQDNLSIVLDKSATVYAASTLDITAQVQKAFA